MNNKFWKSVNVIGGDWINSEFSHDIRVKSTKMAIAMVNPQLMQSKNHKHIISNSLNTLELLIELSDNGTFLTYEHNDMTVEIIEKSLPWIKGGWDEIRKLWRVSLNED